MRSIPRSTAPDKPLTAQEQKKRSRANWWYYNWGIVAVAAMVIVGVAYVAHGLLTTVDPDYTVAVVTAEALPDEAVQHLQTALADYAEDANGDGAVVVQVNNYTWSADAALTDMNGQMAGATQMNTDLSSGESKIWILDDPEGFEQAYGALSEKLGADWQAKLIPWSSQPALSGLELGSYNTAADGSQTVDIQSRFAGYSVAVFDASDALWQALNSKKKPDVVSALRPAFFIQYLESCISRLNVIPCHDLTLSVGEPDNAAAKLRSEQTVTPLHEQSPATYFLRLNNLETFVELVGARPLHLLSQTVLPLKSPTGAFIAALRCANAVYAF